MPELIYSGEIMKNAVEILGPLIVEQTKVRKGKVVLGRSMETCII